MKLNEVSRVVFYPFTHDYVLDGEKTLMGVTSLMKKHGLSPDYKGISEDVLNHAATLGTNAHEAIEAYCDGLPTPDIPLIKSFKKLGLNIVKTEYLVSDLETVASSIDLLNQVDESTVDIIDMKRTSTVHKDALAWQTGIYSYLFKMANPDIKVRRCFCLPIKKGNKDDILKDTCGKLVEINPVQEADVIALLKCEKAGTIYSKEDTPSDGMLEAFINGHFPMLHDSLARIAELQSQIDEVQSLVDDAKAALYDYMLENNVDSCSVNGVSITLKKPYTRSSIDTTKLKNKYPDIAEEMTKTSEVKGNITIKIK